MCIVCVRLGCLLQALPCLPALSALIGVIKSILQIIPKAIRPYPSLSEYSNPSLHSFSSFPSLSASSVKNLVDLYGKDELIYLGPDEQVSARMMRQCYAMLQCMSCEDHTDTKHMLVWLVRPSSPPAITPFIFPSFFNSRPLLSSRPFPSLTFACLFLPALASPPPGDPQRHRLHHPQGCTERVPHPRCVHEFQEGDQTSAAPYCAMLCSATP